MKVQLLAVALMAVVVMPAAAEVHFDGGDGKTIATAVLVQGAASDAERVHSECRWLAKHTRGLRRTGQGLPRDGNRVGNVLHVQDKDEDRDRDKQIAISFDITEFFGKP